MKITKHILDVLCPQGKDSITGSVAEYFNTYAEKYGITTPSRIAHFFAQAAHESAHFATLEEYASGAAYEGRKDLGNTQPGDGKRYKGRGIFQLTGRANYRVFGNRIGQDLEDNPELASTGEISVQTALEYWKDRKLNGYADVDDVVAVTKRINGGTNGLDDRRSILGKMKNILTQVILNEALNLSLKVDGDIGPSSVEAIKKFQTSKGLTSDGKLGPKTLKALGF
jgi:putative chitinase